MAQYCRDSGDFCAIIKTDGSNLKGYRLGERFDRRDEVALWLYPCGSGGGKEVPALLIREQIYAQRDVDVALLT